MVKLCFLFYQSSGLFVMASFTCNSKPQQLSTYALTLFSYDTEVDGEKVQVGKFKNLSYICIFCKIQDIFDKVTIEDSITDLMIL